MSFLLLLEVMLNTVALTNPEEFLPTCCFTSREKPACPALILTSVSVGQYLSCTVMGTRWPGISWVVALFLLLTLFMSQTSLHSLRLASNEQSSTVEQLFLFYREHLTVCRNYKLLCPGLMVISSYRAFSLQLVDENTIIFARREWYDMYVQRLFSVHLLLQ